MPDEEKASDIYEICLDRKSLCCNRKSGEDTCDKCRTYQMYKIGLEAGRNLGKEDQWKATEKAQKKTSARIRELEKENEQLKAFESHWEEIEEDAKAIAKENAEMKHECDELIARLNGIMSGDVAWQGDMDATIKQNLELKNEIEELKALHESDKKAIETIMKQWESERNKLKDSEFGDAVWQSYINETIRQNIELKRRIYELTNSLTELNRDNLELKEHCNDMNEINEKMKCCVNCEYWNDGDCAKGDAYMFFSADYKCDKWRLAE